VYSRPSIDYRLTPDGLDAKTGLVIANVPPSEAKRVADALRGTRGRTATAPAAKASAAHRYTLRVGDQVTIPAVKQRCAVYTEGGAPELYCARPLHPRHQVTIFRDSILIWKVGNPDRPEWSGKP
jgi:hypothetical protein